MRVLRIVLAAATVLGALTLIVSGSFFLTVVAFGAVLAGSGIMWLMLKAGGN